MAILPLHLARVSNNLRASLTQRQLTRTQGLLAQVQNELATGKRINVPSDNPGDAAVAMQLRRLLEQRKSYVSNLNYADSHLSEVDSTLGSLSDLVDEAQRIASQNFGSNATDAQREEATTAIQALYQRAIDLGNSQFRGIYLFGGDQGDHAPFVPEAGGIRFVGSEDVLQNVIDEGTMAPFMVNGNEIFGALSTRVQGNVNLSPRITAATHLRDLHGASGDGVRLGTIEISDGVTSANVDLSKADSVGDVINAINAAAVGGITASLAPDGNSLLLSGAPADAITVKDMSVGTTAADLGIRTVVAGPPGASIDGQDLKPTLTSLTHLADMRGGLGIDTAGGLTITNGLKTATINLAAAVTVQDMLNLINDSGTGVVARINSAGTGIDILNPIQGLAMTIAENGGTTATDLGVRSFGPNSPLSELNGGRGVQMVTGADFQVIRRDGTNFSVDINGATTIQDVINAINAADAGGGVTASFATTGNGIVLTDSTGGAGSLTVNTMNACTAADDLGIRGASATPTLTGKDVNAVEVSGLIANLAKLRDAFVNSDQQAITRAAEGLQADHDRIVRIRGQVGAQIQDIKSRLDRLDEQNVATQALLSTVEDTDYTDAITRFQTLQTSLQANLQTAGKMLDLSLLDFLG